MACLCCCSLSKIFGLALIYGYPAYKVIKTGQSGKVEKLWVIYFLIIGIFYILEGTLLFPIILILSKISKKIYPFMKIAFHLWLYYPEYRGALLLEQNCGKFIDMAYLKSNPIVGKFVEILGIPNRDKAAAKKKNE